MATDTADSTVTHKRATVHPEKADAVAELAEAFRTSAAAVLTEYRGLTVKQLQELRRAMGASTSYSVSKNTLTKLAARDAGLTDLDALLTGPTAVAFVHGDPVEAAKGLRDFGRANPALVVKGGVMDGKSLTADEIRRLADLESREVLLAKLAGAMKASLSQAVYLLNAPLSQAARVLGALQTKAAADPSILAGGAGTPAAAAESADTSAEVVDAGTEGADAQADTDPGSSDASSEPAGTDAAAETSEPVASSDGADSTDSTQSAEASDATNSTESTSTDGTSTESSSTEDA